MNAHINAYLFEKILISLDPVGTEEFILEFAKGKSFREFYESCPNPEWLLWLFHKTKKWDTWSLTLAKAHIARKVEHLMQDELSKIILRASFAFAEGRIDEGHLTTIADLMAKSAYYGDIPEADTAAYYAGCVDNPYDVVMYVMDATPEKEKEQMKQSILDTCRKFLPFEIWNLKAAMDGIK